MPDLVGGAVRSAMRRLCRKQGRSAAVIAHRGRFHCAWRLDMVAARGRRRGCCGGKRYHERGSQVSWVWQAMVAGLAAGILALCLSQSALAQTAPRPSKPDEAAHKPATQKGLTQTPATQGAVPKPPAAAQPGRPPDLVYGAFQRGYFLTAFALATNRVTNAADAKAMTLLGELYANGLGVAQDDQRAAEWYRLAAARSDSNAMFALAIFALRGRAGPRDRQASTQWLTAAANLGHPIAAYDLALLYIEGQMFTQDLARAAEFLRIAAVGGRPDAQYALGTFYKAGRGVPQDMHQAVQLWGQAALADNIDAQVEYAIALYNGDGIAPNQEAATALFRKAAKRGSPIAQDRLARILASGRGAPIDLTEATKWHLISRAGGETDLELDNIVNKLDPQTRAAGEKAAKPWLDAMEAARTAQAAEQAQAPAAGPAPQPASAKR